MKIYTIIAVLIFLGTQGCSSNSSNPNDATDSDGLVSTDVVDVPGSLTAAARAYLFDYAMTGVNGLPAIARAQLFEPAGVAPQDGYPLVVWAHGTTGIANSCTPSSSFAIFGNATAINSLLAAGYAVLAPDYEGFGTPTIHPYYVRSSHAAAVISAVPAAHEVEGTNLSDDWAMVGHSQGGHVALATARAAGSPAYPLQATVALAPGTDLIPFSDRAFEAIDLAVAEGEIQIAAERTYYMNVYAAFVAHAIHLIDPEFDPESIFGDTVAALIDQAIDEPECGDYANAIADAIDQHLTGGGTLADFAGIRRDWYNETRVAERIAIEMIGDEVQSTPLLIVQGDADRQVPIAATTAFVDKQLSLGTDVTYEIVAGGRHGDVARSQFSITVDWLATRFPAN